MARLNRLRPQWQNDALCREFPEINWFPPPGGTLAPQTAICARCLVRLDCLSLDYSRG